MGQIHLPGNPPIEVLLRRSARARQISLRLSRLDGRVTVTVPKRVPESEAVSFVREKEAWLRGHLAKHEGQEQVRFGTVLPLAGVPHEVVVGQGRSPVAREGQLAIPGGDATVAPKVRAFLKQLARDRLVEASDHYAAKVGRSYARITLRDTRSRWGSCTFEGNLMYSWRLALAPPDVLDYVAAHEVAHLVQMNHSQAFWDVVEDIYGPWKAQRKWLHTEGPRLHRFRFGD